MRAAVSSSTSLAEDEIATALAKAATKSKVLALHAKDAVATADKDPMVHTFFWYTNQDLTNTTRREASFARC